MTIRKGATTKGTLTKADDAKITPAARLPPDVALVVKQEGRCQAWIDRLSASAKKCLTKEKDAKFQELNRDTGKQLSANLDLNCKEEV